MSLYKNVRKGFLTLVIFVLPVVSEAQVSLGLDYSVPFLSSKMRGDLKSSNLIGINMGTIGDGWKPFGSLSLNYLRVTDGVQQQADTVFKYRKVMFGIELGMRPLSKKFHIRFQPIVKVGAKMSSGFLKENVSKIAFVSLSPGFEYFITDIVTVYATYSNDLVYIDTYRTRSGSVNMGIKILVI